MQKISRKNINLKVDFNRKWMILSQTILYTHYDNNIALEDREEAFVGYFYDI